MTRHVTRNVTLRDMCYLLQEIFKKKGRRPIWKPLSMRNAHHPIPIVPYLLGKLPKTSLRGGGVNYGCFKGDPSYFSIGSGG